MSEKVFFTFCFYRLANDDNTDNIENDLKIELQKVRQEVFKK